MGFNSGFKGLRFRSEIFALRLSSSQRCSVGIATCKNRGKGEPICFPQPNPTNRRVIICIWNVKFLIDYYFFFFFSSLNYFSVFLLLLFIIPSLFLWFILRHSKEYNDTVWIGMGFTGLGPGLVEVMSWDMIWWYIC